MTTTLTGPEADRAIATLRRRASATPPLAELGSDLLETSRRQLMTAVARPCLAVAVYIWAATTGRWILAVMVIPAVFAATVVVVHDLMHRSLGLRPRTNSVLLGILTMLMLDSGHALQRTHHAHHCLYPSAEDPEGYLASWPVWRVILEGPRYRYRLWHWVWRHHPETRRAVVLEGAIHAGLLIAAAIFGTRIPLLSMYVAVGTIGSWLFPLVSVTAVHDVHGDTPLHRTKTLRGRLLPRAMLGMGYHLEHHLWPTIPAHHLGELARRTEQILRHAGARITRVP
jgi:beta-carotene hydroxylase